MCKSVIRAVDATDSLNICVWASPRSTSLSRLSGLLAQKLPDTDDRGETFVDVGHTIFLVLPRVQPNKTKNILAYCYPLRAPVKPVGVMFDWAPSGLGFRRRVAPEHRHGTKR